MGIRNDEYQTWESVKLYYLKSDGSVEKIALNGDVTGGPAKVSGTEQMDFSESFITLGNKTFLDFEIGYSASEPTTVLFGVNDGNYTSTSVYGYFRKRSMKTTLRPRIWIIGLSTKKKTVFLLRQ